MVDGSPDPETGEGLASGIGDSGLGPDCALEEGGEDVRDSVDVSEDEGISAAVDSGAEGQGALLALGEVGGAQGGGAHGEESVAVVRAAGDQVRTQFRF